jgi:hypothetical protein
MNPGSAFALAASQPIVSGDRDFFIAADVPSAAKRSSYQPTLAPVVPPLAAGITSGPLGAFSPGTGRPDLVPVSPNWFCDDAQELRKNNAATTKII